MPKRIQRQRTAGWRMPDGAVYVGRPTKWGNVWRLNNAPLGHPNPQQWAVDAYREWLWEQRYDLVLLARQELAGKDLACWCKDGQPCHGDVLLEVANGGQQ